MNTRLLLTSAIFASVASANAAFGTFASFFDTGVTSFSRSSIGAGDGTLTASGTGYTLITQAGTFTDVDFSLASPVGFTASGLDALTDAGTFVFTKGGATLLTIDFDIATLNSSGLHASFATNDGVVFGGDLVNGPITIDPVNPMAGFDFSFTNPINVGAGRTYSSAFSASANFQAVPEPATMAALGMGALALLRRRRKA